MIDEYRWFLADLRTGGEVIDLPGVMESSNWSATLNAPETLRAEINMLARDVYEFNPRAHTYPGKVMLGCASGDTIHGLGPIWTRRYSRDTGRATLNARGIWSVLDHRFILSLLATTISTADFTVPDTAPGAVKGQYGPNPALQVAYQSLSLGTITKRLVQLALTHTGGQLPIVFGSDEPGGWSVSHDALEFANLGQVIRDYTRLNEGIDIQFKPRFADSGARVEFVLRTGTNENPLLAGGPHAWTAAAGVPNASGLQVDDDASGIASRAWATGGRGDDKVLVARHQNPSLLDLGFPLYEVLDSSHSSEEDQEMLDGYAAELTDLGFGASETLSFTAERDRVPLPGSYDVGDWADLTIPAWDPDTLQGDPWYREGLDERRRIVGLEGAHGSRTITVTTAPSKE